MSWQVRADKGGQGVDAVDEADEAEVPEKKKKKRAHEGDEWADEVSSRLAQSGTAVDGGRPL